MIINTDTIHKAEPWVITCKERAKSKRPKTLKYSREVERQEASLSKGALQYINRRPAGLKVPAAKLSDLSSILGTHVAEGKHQLQIFL